MLFSLPVLLFPSSTEDEACLTQPSVMLGFQCIKHLNIKPSEASEYQDQHLVSFEITSLKQSTDFVSLIKGLSICAVSNLLLLSHTQILIDSYPNLVTCH